MKKVLLSVFLLLTIQAYAQQGIGFRFGSNINTFPRAIDHGLVANVFTTGQFGVFYSQYHIRYGFEAGMNVVHKGGNFNLPVIMNDYDQSNEQNVGFTAIEMDLKAGPRLGAINPKIGYILGYRFNQTGFQTPGNENPVNPIYLMLPFGASFNLPTQYGSVGAGIYYNVGIFNVLSNPGPGTGAIYEGGRQRYLNIEIVVTFGRTMPREKRN